MATSVKLRDNHQMPKDSWESVREELGISIRNPPQSMPRSPSQEYIDQKHSLGGKLDPDFKAVLDKVHKRFPHSRHLQGGITNEDLLDRGSLDQMVLKHSTEEMMGKFIVINHKDDPILAIITATKVEKYDDPKVIVHYLTGKLAGMSGELAINSGYIERHPLLQMKRVWQYMMATSEWDTKKRE